MNLFWCIQRQAKSLPMPNAFVQAGTRIKCVVGECSPYNGRGLEEMMRVAGSSCSSFVLPESPTTWQESEFLQACE